jgi:hypothetical protein
MAKAFDPEKFRFQDHPEIAETFVDSLNLGYFDGVTVRIELCATRLDMPKPPKEPTGRRELVSRIVLTPEAAAKLHGQLNGFVQQMIQIGVLKADRPDGKPN